MPSGGDFRFGPYRLDLRSGRLLRGEVVVPIQPRQLQLLQVFLEHAGELLSKDQLIDAVWKGTAVSDTSLTQAIFHLRTILDPDNPTRYIETAARVGYRFVAPVSRVVPRHSDAELDALLAPYRGFIDGRAALESLEVAAIARARRMFDDLVAGDPDNAMFHVGLANACVLQFESTRTDAAPDTEALDVAVRHAREACRLRADYGEAWATLGFVLGRAGRGADAVAALHRSIRLEPDNWRHHLRLSYGTWGEERLRAARRTLELFPGCAMARWLAATVYVARGALHQAEQEIDAGLASAQGDETDGQFAAVALYWLKGLLCLARGAEAEALGWFARELELEPRGHLYGREIAANTWYAIGACRRRQKDLAAARAAFDEALARVPRHPLAAAGVALVDRAASAGGRGAKTPRASGECIVPAGAPIEFTLGHAAWLAVDDAASGAALVDAALAAAPPGSAGWTVPIDPLLAVAAAPEPWAPALARIGQRAG